MRASTQIFLGIAPAVLLTVGGLLLADVASSAYHWALLTSALLGTIGLIWALKGYARQIAPVVLLLLLVGVLGILIGGFGGALSAVAVDAQNHRLGTPLNLLLRGLLLGWLIVGPAAVGVLQARIAFRRMRAVA
jgi:hypothetical protein